MLLTLSIKNFILINSLNLELRSGLYVVTGETGSGKSVLLDSLLFVLGEKFDVEVVKSGEEYTTVNAIFSNTDILKSILEESGIASEETIAIKRQQYPGGKKRFFINDEPVTQKLVSTIATELVEIHGQHSYSQLLNPSEHLKILDKFADLEQERYELASKFQEWQKLQSSLESVTNEKESLLREIDYLSFVVTELKEKSPKLGEEAKLTDSRLELQTFAKNQSLVKELTDLFGSANLYSVISNMQRIMARQTKDDSFSDILSNLEQVEIYLREVESSISSLNKYHNLGDLDKIETRLFEIRDLARKYKMLPDELQGHLEKSEDELSKLQTRIQSSEELKSQVREAEEEYILLAQNLSLKRKEGASKLEKRIQTELEPLRMKGCIWKVEFAEKDISQAKSHGIDDVRFIASTNPGVPAAPIDKIASGGELARMMLAVKVALFDKFLKPTIIFDEVDTGIGGSVADAVGTRLQYLSKIAQTIVITHQPQVAAKADYNILVTKTTDGASTYSTARILSESEKINEVARMLAGRDITVEAVAAAQELIKA